MSTNKKALREELSNPAIGSNAYAPTRKDHQVRELVNELRDIAVEYHGTQQLRERIARTIRAAMLHGYAKKMIVGNE